jgi:ribulose-phosphate 3-epimerase
LVRSKLVAPSILSADFANLEKEIKMVSEAGADWIHVDVMDGHFVPNLTIGIPVVESLKRVSQIPLDVHLMIEKPERFVKAFVKAGADNLTIHVEATKDPAAVLKEIRQLGAKAGLTLRPGTRIEEVLPFLDLVDLVLVMTVEPGFGGQGFMVNQVEKISRLRQEIDSRKLKCLIEVDGGVNAETISHLKEVDVLVAGSYIFSKDYRQAITTLKNG